MYVFPRHLLVVFPRDGVPAAGRLANACINKAKQNKDM